MLSSLAKSRAQATALRIPVIRQAITPKVRTLNPHLEYRVIAQSAKLTFIDYKEYINGAGSETEQQLPSRRLVL